MCGIFGSPDLSTYEILMGVNADRGSFSTGIANIFPDGQVQTLKIQGQADLDEVKLSNLCSYYTGHLQAPTSSTRFWSANTSHPFESDSYIVHHNGVLTNADELVDKYNLEGCGPVDSSVIPKLIEFMTFDEDQSITHPYKDIVDALSELEGTFALCIISKLTNDIFIARQGSALFMKGHNFSSIAGNGYVSVPEGSILQLDASPIASEKFIEVAKFKTTSPFLFL